MSISTRFAALTAVAAMMFGVGCASTDRHVFNSLPERPVTVMVIDTVNEEPVWVKPVPGGQKLILNLDHSSTSDNPFMTAGVPADRLSWKTYPLESKAIVKGYQAGRPLDTGMVRLPGTPVRLHMVYGDATGPAPAPAPAPTADSEPAPPSAAEQRPSPAAVEEETPMRATPQTSEPQPTPETSTAPETPEAPDAAEASDTSAASESAPEPQASEQPAPAEQTPAEESPAAPSQPETPQQEDPIMFK